MRRLVILLLLALALAACGEDARTWEISNESRGETVVLFGTDSDGKVVKLATLESGDTYHEEIRGNYCVHSDLTLRTPDGEMVGEHPGNLCLHDGWVYLSEPETEHLP